MQLVVRRKNHGTCRISARFKNRQNQTGRKNPSWQGTESPPSAIWIIEIDGVLAGEMNHRFVEEDIYEIGIKICRFDLQNHGYGHVAVNLLLDYLFIEQHAKKVILDTNLANTGAQRFYETLGFIKTGIFENSWKDQLGQMQSSVSYEITKDTFLNR